MNSPRSSVPSDPSTSPVGRPTMCRRTRSEKRLPDLLDEERIALRAPTDELAELDDARVVPEEAVDHLARRLAPERGDGQLLIVRASHPRGVELRPEVQQEKCPRRAGHVGKRGEQPLALRIDPVGIVEIDHERSGGAAGAEQASEQACDRTLLLDGISRGL